jgi:hypothetical protein
MEKKQMAAQIQEQPAAEETWQRLARFRQRLLRSNCSQLLLFIKIRTAHTINVDKLIQR